MIRIEVAGETGTAFGPFPLPFITYLGALNGRKDWKGTQQVRFVASGNNLKRLREAPFPIEWIDTSGAIAELDMLAALSTQHDIAEMIKTDYTPNKDPRDYQRKAVDLSAFRTAYAYLFEMGLGKTYIAIFNMGILHCAGKLTGVLVLSPKGVHEQWIEEQVPEHIDKKVAWHGVIWEGKDVPVKMMNRRGLTILSMNIDAIRTDLGFEVAERFLKLHAGKSMMIVDESHLIKTWSSSRSQRCNDLGKLATFRRIMTGTPIAINLTDMWAQFRFLDERILGHDTITSFKARYIQVDRTGRRAVGTKNVEEFYSLIAPHSFRMTKDEALDLPPKIYTTQPYTMDDKTAKKYREMKETFMTGLSNGEIVDAPNAAVAMLRLQQIVCGYLPGEDGYMEVISNQRIEETLNIIAQTAGPTVIWARFQQDIDRLKEALAKEYGSSEVVTYDGRTKDGERSLAKSRFLGLKSRFFISNQAAGGTGLNLQGHCETVIYHSNSFNAIHRWQSEDRTHRMGMKGSVTYFDPLARGSVDMGIRRNLQGKKSISDLTLDQIRQMVAGGD